MINFNGFEMIRRKMGISTNEKSNFKTNIQFRKTVWEDPEIDEVEISANDEGFMFTDDGIYYQGRRVILYIRDVQNYWGYDMEPKFHLTSCAILKGMLTKKTYEKYVVAIRTDGKFKLNYISNNIIQKTVEKDLYVCKHCLRALNWKNYKFVSERQRRIIFEKFLIEEFFKSVNDDNEKIFSTLPDYTEETAPLNIYPENWKIISKMLRKEAGYICSDCGRKILDPKKLHVHHINSIKQDCFRSNLEVLCADCHQKRHSHKILGSSRNKSKKIIMQGTLGW